MNKKKLVFWVMICMAVLSLSTTVMAETTSRRANIQSRGNINYENGTVYFASSDLTYLADEIDELEERYKRETIESLNSIGTFFRKDGTVVKDPAGNEVHSAEDQKALSFGNILTGIQTSQSVDFLYGTQARDQDGNLLYYENPENPQIGYVTAADTGAPVYYQAADADNLSAGTAAWVNGVLIKGNGKDNRESLENAKKKCKLKKVNLGEVTVKANGNVKKINISSKIPDWEEKNITMKSFAFESAWFASGDNYTDAGNSHGLAVIKEYSNGVVSIGTEYTGGHESENCYTKVVVVCYYIE